MEATLRATLRDGKGKGPARRLRAEGQVPAILYGAGVEPTQIAVDGLDLLHLFHKGGTSQLIDLEVDGATHLAIPREVQRDYIRGRFIHVDFLAVDRDRTIHISIEVREVGEAAGIKEGGVIEHHAREVEVECLPSDVPDHLEIDVTNLEIGDMARAGDIVAPEGVTILADPDTPIVSVIVPQVLQVEADLTVPGEEVAEGEVAPEGEAPAEEVPEGEAAVAEAPEGETAGGEAQESGEG